MPRTAQPAELFVTLVAELYAHNSLQIANGQR